MPKFYDFPWFFITFQIPWCFHAWIFFSHFPGFPEPVGTLSYKISKHLHHRNCHNFWSMCSFAYESTENGHFCAFSHMKFQKVDRYGPKLLTSTKVSAHTFLNQQNSRRNVFMVNPQKSCGRAVTQTCNPWICSQMCCWMHQRAPSK